MTRTSENNAGEIQNGEHETVEVFFFLNGKLVISC